MGVAFWHINQMHRKFTSFLEKVVLTEALPAWMKRHQDNLKCNDFCAPVFYRYIFQGPLLVSRKVIEKEGLLGGLGSPSLGAEPGLHAGALSIPGQGNLAAFSQGHSALLWIGNCFLPPCRLFFEKHFFTSVC